MATDLYQTLGVPRTATEKEIRSAYRRLARKFHPDVNPGDKAGEARFKEVNAAYEVLSDADKRAKYDRYGDQWEHADQIEEMRRQQAGSSRYGGGGSSFRFETAGDGADFGSIFENIFRRDRAGRTAAGPRRGQDLETPVEVSLEEAARGVTRTIVVGGERRLEVKVPPGVKTGSRVRVAGEGMPGINGGASGDVYLVITVAPHGRFERKADDLHVEVEVPVLDAILGGEVEVPTLDGRVMLRIPELTQNGRQFRLSGKGMPVLAHPDRRGDLYARIRVHLPASLTDEERDLYRKIQASNVRKEPVR